MAEPHIKMPVSLARAIQNVLRANPSPATPVGEVMDIVMAIGRLQVEPIAAVDVVDDEDDEE